MSISAPYYQSPHNIQIFTPVLPSNFGPRFHSHHPIISLPTIYSSSPFIYLPLLASDITLRTILSVSPQHTVLHPSVTFHFCPQISLSAPYYQSPHYIKFFTPLLPSHFGPKYHSLLPIISLPTIYSSSPLCHLPLLSPDITLSTMLSVSSQYTVLHPSVTFHFCPRISLSAPYYESPQNIQFFPPCYLPVLTPDITPRTLLWVSPQYTVLHPCVTFHFWPQISLSAPYYLSPHNKQFFTPLLLSHFSPWYHSQHPIISLPTIYSFSPLFYLPLLTPDVTLSTLLWVSPQYTDFHPCVTFPF